MSTDDNNTGTLLHDPLSISDLIKDGTHFQINANFDEDILNDDFFDELNVDCSDDEDETKRKKIVSPWEKSFEELRSIMTKVNEDIYKRVTRSGNSEKGSPQENSRVIIEYNAYWEKDTEPFDSSFMRGDVYTFYCGHGEVLEGLEQAVRTMHKGEEAQFVISYRLLFREMGCPPRIKPRADGLFIIKLCDFNQTGNENALDEISKEDRNKFPIVIERVKDVHMKGLDFFKHKKYSSAIRSFHKAVTALEFCQLGNDEEQDEQRKFLIKLYTNLAVCYNNLNIPNKACSMINEIRRISNIKQNCKALFHEGRALLMLGEFKLAKVSLQCAQQLEPNNPSISSELKILAEKYENYKNNEKSTWQKAIGIMENVNNKNTEKEKEIDEFKTEIRRYIKNFKDNGNTNELTLPRGLSANELDCINELIDEMDLKLQINDACEPKTYTIKKK